MFFIVNSKHKRYKANIRNQNLLRWIFNDFFIDKMNYTNRCILQNSMHNTLR